VRSDGGDSGGVVRKNDTMQKQASVGPDLVGVSCGVELAKCPHVSSAAKGAPPIEWPLIFFFIKSSSGSGDDWT